MIPLGKILLLVWLKSIKQNKDCFTTEDTEDTENEKNNSVISVSSVVIKNDMEQ